MKKTTVKAEKVTEKKGVNVAAALHGVSVASLIKKPRITEKSTQVAEKNVYTFDVAANATKTQIMEAIFGLYKVKPMKVNVVNNKQRNVIVRGKRGKQAGGRKAYVTLKKGDKIELA
jgi:large subunit ribosomal protein L23